MKCLDRDAVIARLEQSKGQILKSLKMAQEGVPLAAEPDTERAVARLQRKANLPRETAEALHLGLTKPGDGREQIWGATVDFVGVAFLLRGWHASRAVARVAFRDGRPNGSGFLVAPGLFLTSNHVIGTPDASLRCAAEFDYERDMEGQMRMLSRFEFDPDSFFITDDTNDLDYTLIALGRRLGAGKDLSAFGYCPLSSAGDKHSLGEFANIIQHPGGRHKEVVVRENRLAARLEHVLHYVADTEPGSSGSPVFNSEWRPIALHHWGSPWRQRRDASGNLLPRKINEGIRISSIVKELRERAHELTAAQRLMLSEALALGEEATGPALTGDSAAPDGTVTWRVPIEISVSLPALSAPRIPAP